MGDSVTLVTVLSAIVTALTTLVGWGLRQLVKGTWVPERTHVRELEREQSSAEGWRRAYFTLLDGHDRTVAAMETLMAGTRATTRVIEALPVPQPPEPPGGASDAPVAA